MINGNTLLDRGWPEGPMIGAALDVVTAFVKARVPDDHILEVLEDVRRKPDLYDDPEHAAQPLAKAVKAHRKEQRKKKQREAVREQVRDEPLEAPIWGEDLIDPEAIQQLRDAMRLPATVAGALMPDAHIGYGIPIGGVVALDNAVAPYMVGVDIACFHGDTLVQTIDGHAYPIAELAKRREQFGVWTCTSEGKVEAGWASAHKTGTQKALIEIHLDNEEVIRCTPDHEFMLRDGTYRRADALTEGTSLMPFYYGIDSEGYFRVCQNDSERSGTQVGHWVVARAGLMGPIPSFEEQKTVIHHKDFDGTNNDPSNLEFMGDHDHSAYHRSLVERNEYWQSEAFEEARKAALAAKAATPEGYAGFAARADRLNAYLAENAEVREHINHQVSRNNRTSERREQSREIASRTYACGICGREIKSVIALNSHFRHKHAEDYSWDACYDGTPINHEVVAVRQTGERADVFCLQVPSHGNFALAAGVFVHNCRMMMSVYPAEMGLMLHDQGGREDLKRIMREETRFGLGASFAKGERRQHAVLDDPDWDATPLLRGLKDKAHAQLGTSGTGNHFVDAGLLDIGEAGADALGLPSGTYLALLTHSGSRGPGATIANHYSKLAKKHSKLPRSLQQLAYFDLDSELGQEYWLSMNLAGRFASACHHAMHEAFARRLGETPLTQVENHHNYAWRERVQGRDVIVHRKGATPAHEGVLGIIPGSQGHDSFIAQGKGNAASLNSASHGAGRVMSRTQAFKTIPRQARNRWLEERGIELLAGGMDEAPQAYKDIEEVLAVQDALIATIARFRPKLVLMADDGKSEG